PSLTVVNHSLGPTKSCFLTLILLQMGLTETMKNHTIRSGDTPAEAEQKDEDGREIAPQDRRFSAKKRFIVNIIIIFAIK
ncbi:MAG: hypothetical protein Q4E71_00240, partial [Prevotella sp.]|nr:hypothetical protein [Prevotella sp.]